MMQVGLEVKLSSHYSVIYEMHTDANESYSQPKAKLKNDQAEDQE